MFEDKRTRISCCVLLASILLLALIPERVPVYRGDYTVIYQERAGTSIYALNLEAISSDFPSGEKEGYVMTGKTLDEVLKKLFTEDYNVLSYFPRYGSSEKKIFPLNKIHVPELSGTEYTLTGVEFRIKSVIFYIAGLDETTAELVFCNEWYCSSCDAYQEQYDAWMKQGKTDWCIATRTLKAISRQPTASELEDRVSFFGEAGGMSFHGTATGPDSGSCEKLVSELKLRAVYPTNTPVLLYYLAEAARPILLLSALGSAALLLWMGLSPLRKKQTIPDG